jgi:hypothetical protein
MIAAKVTACGCGATSTCRKEAVGTLVEATPTSARQVIGRQVDRRRVDNRRGITSPAADPLGLDAVAFGQRRDAPGDEAS